MNSNNTNFITVNTTDDEDNQIMKWLSPLKPEHGYQSVQSSGLDDVGCWFLETKVV